MESFNIFIQNCTKNNFVVCFAIFIRFLMATLLVFVFIN